MTLRDASIGAVIPPGIAPCELVEIRWNLHQGPRHARIAGVVLALVGVDIPVTATLVGGKGLIGLAVATLD